MSNPFDILYSQTNAAGNGFTEKILSPVSNRLVGCGPTGELIIVTGSFEGTSSYSETSSFVEYSRPKPSSYELTEEAIIQTDGTQGEIFRVTLTENRTLGNPTASFDGQRLMWELIQDSSGSRNISLDTKFVTGSNFSVSLNGTGSKRDFMTAIYNKNTDKWYVVGFVTGY